MKTPYTVEPAEESCEKCGRDRYVVLGPDSVGTGTMYNERVDAEEAARDLNTAFARGAATTVSKDAIRAVALEAAAGNGITWHDGSRTLACDGDVDDETAMAMTLVELFTGEG